MTDKDKSVEFSKLFKDLTTNFEDSDVVKSSTVGITFILPNDSEVQLLSSSKNSGKYRIQSNQFESLVFVNNLLIQALNEFYMNEIIITMDGDIPFDKFFEKAYNLNEIYLQIRKNNEELENYSNLYGQVQKSILNKYKEKTPPSLNNLDFMITDLHLSMNEMVKKCKEAITELKICFKDILVWTEGILIILKLKAKLSENQYTIIRDLFILDNLDLLTVNSWIEITLANMTNFFKFYFNKSNDLVEIKQDLENFDKWKKYFKSLIEKIIKKEGF